MYLCGYPHSQRISHISHTSTDFLVMTTVNLQVEYWHDSESRYMALSLDTLGCCLWLTWVLLHCRNIFKIGMKGQQNIYFTIFLLVLSLFTSKPVPSGQNTQYYIYREICLSDRYFVWHIWFSQFICKNWQCCMTCLFGHSCISHALQSHVGGIIHFNPVEGTRV